MSNVVSKDVICPKCNYSTSVSVYTSINVTKDPQFKEDLLNGKLLQFICEKCGYTGRFTYPILYNDMQKQFMVYFVPEIDRFQLEDRALEEDYRNLKGLKKRIAPDFNSFREKVYIFDIGLDDMAVELAKLAISDIVAKKFSLSRIEEGYLTNYNREKNEIGFTYFIGEDKKPYLQNARIDIYAQSLKMVDEICQNDRKLSGFIKIDKEWAENTLFRYKRIKNE